MATEFAVRIDFRRGDGRCYISSPDLVGLHLAGSDMNALRADLEAVIKDLVYHNLSRVIDKLRFIPSLEEIADKYHTLQSLEDSGRTEVCLIQLQAA
jgi:hypothetical protein